MNIKNELIEIKHHFLKWVVVFFVVTVLFFAVPVSFPNQEQSSDSFLIKSSQEDKKSLASHFFIKIKKDLLQSNVELISTSPIAIFIVQIKIAGLLAFLLTLPYLLYCFFMYLTPALLSREKKVFFLTSFSFAMLFLTGVIFSYVFLVPQMFRALLGFSQSFELTPYLAVDEFIS